MLTATERSIRARMGAFAQQAACDVKVTTAAARRAFFQRFLDAVPADLPEEERVRRAQAALRAHMNRLALKSIQARQRRKEAAK